MTKTIFIIGITGYIGGSVFTILRAAHPEFTYTTLVRSPSQIPAVTVVGATPILGSSTDRDTVLRLVSEADIVINCMSADDVPLIELVLEGMRRRKAEGKSVGTLIHTSGTAVFADVSKEGKTEAGQKIWSDTFEDVKSITPQNFHGQVDVPIFDAANAGDVYSYIICPSAIHGIGTGPVSRVSSFSKMIASTLAQTGRGMYIGEGSNVFGFIHVSDLASLYLLVFNHALANYPPTNSPYERYYIASTESVTWKRMVELFTSSLHRRGLIASPTPAQVTYEEAGEMAFIFAINAHAFGERGKELRWTPSGPRFEETVEGDLDMAFPSSQ